MRYKSVLKKLSFGLALLITLGFLTWQIENVRGRHAWDRYKAQAEAEGEILDPKTIIPPLIPESSNFAATPFFSKLFAAKEEAGQRHEGGAPATPPAANEAHERVADYFTPLTSAMKSSNPKTNELSHTWFTGFVDLAGLVIELRNKNAADNRVGNGMAVPGAEAKASAASSTGFATNGLSVAEAATELLLYMRQFEPVLNEMAAAAARPQARYPIEYDQVPSMSILLPHLRVLREAATALGVGIAARLEFGRADEAAAEVVLLLRLAESLKDEPLLISYLVRVALLQSAYRPLIDGFSRGAWSDGQLAHFQRLLLSSDLPSDLRKALDGEMVLFGVNTMDQLRRGLISEEAIGDASISGLGRWLPDGWLYLEMINYHKAMRASRDAGFGKDGTLLPQKPDTELVKSLEQPEVKLLLRHRLLSKILLPDISRIFERSARAQTGTQLAGLACALERHRLATGAYPRSLSELESLLGRPVPRDIITGTPFKYELTAPTRYVLYATGPDRKDDGGKPFLERMNPEKQTGTDWVWTPVPRSQTAAE